MASRKRRADDNDDNEDNDDKDAGSSKPGQKRQRGPDKKKPAAAAPLEPVATAVLPAVAPSPVAATPAGAAAVAAKPATDKHGVSTATRTALVPLVPSPAHLYPKGMHYIGMAGSSYPSTPECKHIQVALCYADAMFNVHLTKAAIWYRHALNLAKGLSNETVLSGHAYYGLGEVAKYQESSDEALVHYRQGALLGHAKCQHTLGYYLEQGHIVPRDVRAAYHWYRLAAAAGNRVSALHLGLPLSSRSSLPRSLPPIVSCSRLSVPLRVPR